MKTVFALQENISFAGEEKTVTSYKLLKKDGDKDIWQPCTCPIMQKNITSDSFSEQRNIHNNSTKLFIPAREGIAQTRIEKEQGKITQKYCSSECIAFQIFERKKEHKFRCNWCKFNYDIEKIIENKYEPNKN